MRYAGIDWADQHHDVVVIDESGRRLGATRVAHDVEGLEALVAFVRTAGVEEEVACFVETTNGLLLGILTWRTSVLQHVLQQSGQQNNSPRSIVNFSRTYPNAFV